MKGERGIKTGENEKTKKTTGGGVVGFQKRRHTVGKRDSHKNGGPNKGNANEGVLLGVRQEKGGKAASRSKQQIDRMGTKLLLRAGGEPSGHQNSEEKRLNRTAPEEVGKSAKLLRIKVITKEVKAARKKLLGWKTNWGKASGGAGGRRETQSVNGVRGRLNLFLVRVRRRGNKMVHEGLKKQSYCLGKGWK